jgi:hypothetical protein
MLPDGASNNFLPSCLGSAFPASNDALLFAIRDLVTDDMLVVISESDYGMGAAESLAALHVIRDEVRIPEPFRDVQEVLELSRAYYRTEREKIMCAFCCAALMCAKLHPPNEKIFFGGENISLVRSIDCAIEVGGRLPEAAGSFLSWRFRMLAHDNRRRPFLALGMVALALLGLPDTFSTVEVDEMAIFVERVEAEYRDPAGVCTLDMFDGSFVNDSNWDGDPAQWQSLAGKMRSKFPDSSRLVSLTRRIEAR